MNQQFQTAQQLIGDIFHMPIHLLETEDDIQEFSKTYMLHMAQMFLNPDTLSFFVKELSSKKFFHIIDKFELHFFLVLLQGQPVIIGPFCPLILTREHYIKQPVKFQIPGLIVDDLLAYRSQFPTISEQTALHIVQSLIHLLDASIENYEIVHRNYDSDKTAGEESVESPLRKNYSELIQERYQLEQRFLYDIEHGNSHAAILNLRNMQQDVAFLKAIGTTLENERIGAAIVRTMVRIAAMRAGLPAATIDLLSRENTVQTFHAKSVEEIYQEKEKMVAKFCREIRSHQDKNYSNLILSTMYYVEHHYSQNITVTQIADELNVSTNHLIARFRKETGSTPGNYIQQTRLKQAARLLSNTDLNVQNISNMVGIPDTNYFIKLFKREYDMTPIRYRKYYRL